MGKEKIEQGAGEWAQENKYWKGIDNGNMICVGWWEVGRNIIKNSERKYQMLNTLESEMLEALRGVLSAYKDYGAIALRTSEEYKSLTLVRRAIRHAKEKATANILSERLRKKQ